MREDEAEQFAQDMAEAFRHSYRHHDELRTEWDKLVGEPSSKVPKVGSRVVVAAGLLNKGHPWIRLEGTVIEVGETSYKVSFGTRYKTLGEEICWVHPALITDVLSSMKEG